MLTSGERAATVASIARAQTPAGTIPWFSGGRWDPWDHVESAIALDVGGLHDAARGAFRFLARRQRHDGAWACPIVGGRDDDEVLDSNGAAYVAVGAWHHYLCTQDAHFLDELWPVVDRAVDFAVDLQRPDGTIAWARDLGGGAGDHALVAGCSCIAFSLRCAVEIATAVGETKPDWELALTELVEALVSGMGTFADRARYSMDWYYPVLAGVVPGDAAPARIAARWEEFVVAGLGARCVNDRPWITSAETAELTIALALCGMTEEARALFGWAQYLRDADGSYWTGATFPDGRHFPNERSTWSAAAIVIADAVIEGRGPITDVFSARAAARVGRARARGI